MAIHLEITDSDPYLFGEERREKVLRVIGEILPFVLAKYSIDIQPAAREEPKKSNDYSSRFTRA